MLAGSGSVDRYDVFVVGMGLDHNFGQSLGPHSGPYGQSAIRRVRCADQRPRGWHGGRDYDQGPPGHLSGECRYRLKYLFKLAFFCVHLRLNTLFSDNALNFFSWLRYRIQDDGQHPRKDVKTKKKATQ